jgi:hypothetical protein
MNVPDDDPGRDVAYLIPGIGSWAEADLDVRILQPFQATKTYQCPACNQPITKGTANVVVVPRLEPDRRRHFHAPCWDQVQRRRPNRG